MTANLHAVRDTGSAGTRAPSSDAVESAQHQGKTQDPLTEPELIFYGAIKVNDANPNFMDATNGHLFIELNLRKFPKRPDGNDWQAWVTDLFPKALGFDQEPLIVQKARNAGWVDKFLISPLPDDTTTIRLTDSKEVERFRARYTKYNNELPEVKAAPSLP